MASKRKRGDGAKPTDDTLKVRRRKLSDYKQLADNANRGTVRGAAMHEHSIDQFGAARSAVADANDVFLAGNHTAEQLYAAGIEDVIEVETDGKQFVVVKRPDLDASTERGKAYSLYDNRVGQVNLDFDADVLRSLQDDGLDLSGLWNDGELAHVLNEGDELDYDAAWQGMPEFSQQAQNAFKSIIVHFDNEQAVKEFSDLIKQLVTMKTRYIWHPFKPDKDNTQYRVRDES